MNLPLPCTCCLLVSARSASAVCTSSSSCGFFCPNSRRTSCASKPDVRGLISPLKRYTYDFQNCLRIKIKQPCFLGFIYFLGDLRISKTFDNQLLKSSTSRNATTGSDFYFMKRFFAKLLSRKEKKYSEISAKRKPFHQTFRESFGSITCFCLFVVAAFCYTGLSIGRRHPRNRATIFAVHCYKHGAQAF